MSRARTWTAAQRRYEQVLESNPKHLGALLGLAALAELRNDPDALVAALERAKDANPTATQPGLLLARFYITRGDYLKALAVANELATRFPDDEPVLQMLARAQTLGGQVPNAIRSFDQLLQKNPNDPQLHYLAGGARWKGQDHSGAQKAFRRALELKPDFVDAQVALASVSLDAGDTETALQTAKDLQKSYPDAAVGYRIEGSVYVAKRDYKAAAAAFKQAFAREKTSAVARQFADAMNQSGDTGGGGRGARGLGQGQPQGPGCPGHARALPAAGGAPARTPSRSMSAWWRKAPQKNPLLLNNLAWLYHQQGDARAEATAKEAYDLAPSRPEIADTYGWILYNAGEKAGGSVDPAAGLSGLPDPVGDRLPRGRGPGEPGAQRRGDRDPA